MPTGSTRPCDTEKVKLALRSRADARKGMQGLAAPMVCRTSEGFGGLLQDFADFCRLLNTCAAFSRLLHAHAHA
eukprot:364518-Chlamydomonas_euryale.AAC.2